MNLIYYYKYYIFNLKSSLQKNICIITYLLQKQFVPVNSLYPDLLLNKTNKLDNIKTTTILIGKQISYI